MEYNETDYDYNDYPQPEQSASTKGLKIGIVVLLVALIALGFSYWQQVQELKVNEEELLIEKDTLTSRLSVLMGEMGSLRIDNDTMNAALVAQRHYADSLFTTLKKQKSINRSQLRAYQAELGTLRTALRGYVHQIDSLNQLNQKLVGENIKFRKEISGLRTRTEAAEETSTELANKVARAAVVRARDINLVALNKKGKPVSKAKQAEQLVVNCILSANEVASSGPRTVYVRVSTPDGDLLSSNTRGTFTIDGESKPFSASREVEYDGSDLPVSVYVDAADLYPGGYSVFVYFDGMLVGTNEIILK